jgi:hypothetical protein
MTLNPSYDMSYDSPPGTMLPLAQYAASVGVSTRTVTRWLSADKLPGAYQDEDGRWMIPAHAEPDRRPAALERTAAVDVAPVHLEPAPTVSDLLEQLPGLVELANDVDEDTGAILRPGAEWFVGVPASRIRRHREYFDLQPLGDDGVLVMPRARIKEILG